MASEQQVKKYLAYWFQLGKQVKICGGHEALLPQPVFTGDRYSDAFENCWQQIKAKESGDCYLENTQQTIADLLSDQWEISDCSRCSMPVPMRSIGLPALECPCSDLPNWPNTDLPQPRSPVSNADQLDNIRQRLLNINS